VSKLSGHFGRAGEHALIKRLVERFGYVRRKPVNHICLILLWYPPKHRLRPHVPLCNVWAISCRTRPSLHCLLQSMRMPCVTSLSKVTKDLVATQRSQLCLPTCFLCDLVAFARQWWTRIASFEADLMKLYTLP
jgi:hypothetical protein